MFKLQAFLRLLQSSIQLDMAFSIAVYSCWCTTSRFPESFSNLGNNNTSLQRSTTYRIPAIQHVRCHVWHTENLLHQSCDLGCCSNPWANGFCAIVAIYNVCTCHDCESWNMWTGLCACPHKLSCVYLLSALHVAHVMSVPLSAVLNAVPLPNWESWGRL